MTSLLVVSCGGGGGSDSGTTDTTDGGTPSAPNSETQTVSGKVIDGYIEKALVCFDVNANLKCDSDEPQAYTDASGSYSIEDAPSDYVGKYPIVAEIISGVSIDRDRSEQPIELDGNQTSLSLITPAGETIVTPLTTLVALTKTAEQNMADVEALIKAELQLDENISLFEDFIAPEGHDESSDEYWAYQEARGLAQAAFDAVKATVGGAIEDISSIESLQGKESEVLRVAMKTATKAAIVAVKNTREVYKDVVTQARKQAKEASLEQDIGKLMAQNKAIQSKVSDEIDVQVKQIAKLSKVALEEIEIAENAELLDTVAELKKGGYFFELSDTEDNGYFYTEEMLMNIKANDDGSLDLRGARLSDIGDAGSLDIMRSVSDGADSYSSNAAFKLANNRWIGPNDTSSSAGYMWQDLGDGRVAIKFDHETTVVAAGGYSVQSWEELLKTVRVYSDRSEATYIIEGVLEGLRETPLFDAPPADQRIVLVSGIDDAGWGELYESDITVNKALKFSGTLSTGDTFVGRVNLESQNYNYLNCQDITIVQTDGTSGQASLNCEVYTPDWQTVEVAADVLMHADGMGLSVQHDGETYYGGFKRHEGVLYAVYGGNNEYQAWISQAQPSSLEDLINDVNTAPKFAPIDSNVTEPYVDLWGERFYRYAGEIVWIPSDTWDDGNATFESTCSLSAEALSCTTTQVTDNDFELALGDWGYKETRKNSIVVTLNDKGNEWSPYAFEKSTEILGMDAYKEYRSDWDDNKQRYVESVRRVESEGWSDSYGYSEDEVAAYVANFDGGQSVGNIEEIINPTAPATMPTDRKTLDSTPGLRVNGEYLYKDDTGQIYSLYIDWQREFDWDEGLFKDLEVVKSTACEIVADALVCSITDRWGNQNVMTYFVENATVMVSSLHLNYNDALALVSKSAPTSIDDLMASVTAEGEPTAMISAYYQNGDWYNNMSLAIENMQAGDTSGTAFAGWGTQMLDDWSKAEDWGFDNIGWSVRTIGGSQALIWDQPFCGTEDEASDDDASDYCSYQIIAEHDGALYAGYYGVDKREFIIPMLSKAQVQQVLDAYLSYAP
ncbi:MAG: hypothetical protein HWE20_01515 [Gammaproteobacteria bacterium]|nr:hypothetical protein [Gammaproteobacteria bacterium]